ncbi:type II toxin-antitoxin system VapC family toxin [Rickettsia bellii]|uniref:PIN domain protein n=1 Tax=Rickettsia bellii str. RML Mogi TaxID=1359194 RepID=A0A0F3QJP3_RICBE|nr:PIN domain-containing protein [Rickettsia bellii]KJV92820.1 PIN domain protein [Rickettsia bellii str. RML Mogi]
MNKCILDSSALLALFNSEKGWEKVEELLLLSIMSTVNIAEVVAELDKKLAVSSIQSKEMIIAAINKIVPLDFDQSIEVGRLRKETKNFGLSLGDRACIALGLTTGYTIYTADKVWVNLPLNCNIVLIR